MNRLETSRLILRELRRDDSERIFNCWANDPEVTKYLTWAPHQSIEVTKEVLNNWINEYKDDNCYRWGIELKSENQLIGMIDVVDFNDGIPNIGYVLGKAYWNNGYMTEAFEKVIEFLLAEGFEAINITAAKDNIASNRVIQKAGFSFVNSYKADINRLHAELNNYTLKKEDYNK